jgi:hypothetical protein
MSTPSPNLHLAVPSTVKGVIGSLDKYIPHQQMTITVATYKILMF